MTRADDGPSSPANPLQKQRRGGPWPKGVSGNPRGKRPGTRSRAIVALEEIAAAEGEAVLRATVRVALEGDTAAMRLVLDRVYPPRRGRPVQLALPDSTDPATLTLALLRAVAAGELTPEEASGVASLVEAHAKATIVQEFEERLRRLEEEGR